WIWTFFLLRETPVFAAALRRQWEEALSLNARHIETYLSTYFSPNTHLLGEALGLFFIGTLFPSLRRTRRWQRRGWEILLRESAKQVREDGFYFEQSTYYHVYAADIFLHARILAERNRMSIPSEFEDCIQRMLNALAVLGRGGIPPMIGDDDGGRIFDATRNRREHMLDPLATGAVLYDRADFKELAGSSREEGLWLLGLPGLARFDSLPTAPPESASTSFPNSGLYLMTDEAGTRQLFIDAGPLGAHSGGHGHADALSICLARDGESVLIDPGTFEYVGASGERARLRGTGAHNTLRVDGRDQADAAGPFSWQDFPQVRVEQWIRGRAFDLFCGSHDGYKRLTEPVVHRRFVFHKNGEFYLVRDVAEGRGRHDLELAWHIDPAFSRASESLFFSGEKSSLTFIPAMDCGWSADVVREDWSPAYGLAEPASVVRFSARAELPAELATVVSVEGKSPAASGTLTRVHEAADEAAVYRYLAKDCEHLFFFRRQPGQWSAGAFSSDAEFLYISFDHTRNICHLILCAGSWARMAGESVLNSQQRVSYAEVLSLPGRSEVQGSDPGVDSVSPTLHRNVADLFKRGELLKAGS
ncbi:MAG TPA: alginate lyase family protein, partial [Candidatus Binatia bacterium]|nr:alginate lyase family protein [Candidatus Binatia bacterium]